MKRAVAADKEHKTALLIGEPKAVAKQKLMDFATEIEVSYLALIEHMERYVKAGEYWSQGDKFEGVYFPDNLWDAYELVYSKTVPQQSRGSFFSCSC